MSHSVPKIETFLHRERNGTFALYACRGYKKRCLHKRKRKRGKKCDDCVRGREDETLEQLLNRLQRGDA